MALYSFIYIWSAVVRRTISRQLIDFTTMLVHEYL